MNIEAQPIELEHNQAFANQRVLTHPGGYKALAIWHLIIQSAARCPQRGLLVDESGPLGFAELSHGANIPEADVREAFAVLCDPRVKWIEVVECPRNLVVSGSLRAGRKGRPRRPDVLEVESQETGPPFYIEKCFTAVVNIEDEEPTFEAERILPAEFESLVRLTQIAQVIEGSKKGDSGVLDHTGESSTGAHISKELPPFKESVKVLEHAPNAEGLKELDTFVGNLREKAKLEGRMATS